MCGCCTGYISYSLSSCSLEVGASQQRAGDMFVYVEGVLDLCQLIWGVGTLVVVGSTQGNPRRGVEIRTPQPLLAELSHSGRLPASYFRRAPG